MKTGAGIVLFVAFLATPCFAQTSNSLATATEYEISSFAGTIGGLGSTDGIGSRARFFGPAGIWGDDQNLYIADAGNHTIRKIVIATGAVTTFAGTTGLSAFVDGVGTDARFGSLRGLWGDGTFLYVSDQGNKVIRRIEIATATVTTLAGTAGAQNLTDGVGSAARFLGPGPMWGDGTNLYVGDTASTSTSVIRVIRRITIATGQVTTIANLTTTPSGFPTFLGLWGDGTNLFVADSALDVIRKVVISSGQVSTLAGSPLTSGTADGSATTARFNGPGGVWGDGTNLFVSDSYNGTIRQVSLATGDTTTIAGIAGQYGADDGLGPLASFSFPFLMWGSGTNLFVSDYDADTIRRINTGSTIVSTVAGLAGLSGITDGTGADARFSQPTLEWSDGSNLYVTDIGSNTIRQVNLANGAVTTLAGDPNYDTDTDGTGSSAHFSAPIGITGDGKGNLYVSDAGSNTLRKIVMATGQVTTIAGNASAAAGSADGVGTAARFYQPLGIWSDGNSLYAADSQNLTIRKIVLATGQVTTFAGAAGSQGTTDGAGTRARFFFPEGIWGNGTTLYVTDGYGIRKIDIATAQVTTIAGNLTTPGSTDGIGTAASFSYPLGLWGDGSNLYVADNDYATIRKIDLGTNNVTTIIGKPQVYGTENGRGSASRLVSPIGLWGVGATLYVSDDTASNIRAIRAAGSDANVLRFTVANRGGTSSTTIGAGASITVGYGRIQPNADSTTPSGLAIFGFTQSGVLVSEAAVPAAPLVQSARFYAEIAGSVNTGVAIANPNSQAATVSFYFTNSTGSNVNSGTATIPANGQIAKFLDQSPFSMSGSFQGTFTLTSSVPVSLVALRGFTNERSEFLITTLPVTTVDSQIATPLILPHFADGGGWKTQVILVNPTDTTLSGTIQFLSQSSTTISTSAYSIPARTSFKFTTDGTAAAVQVGSVRVAPASGTRAPSALAVFSFRSGGVTVTEAGVPALPVASAFRLYVEANDASQIQSGFAIANSSSSTATITFELTKLDGSSTGLTGSTTVPANGQVAKFLSEIFQNIPQPFKGVLRISGTGIAVVGLRGRYNQRGDFLITTTSPVDEASPVTTAEYVFPHLADGGGYTTQFILFSGTAGQNASGVVRFFDQSGQPLPLTMQ